MDVIITLAVLGLMIWGVMATVSAVRSRLGSGARRRHASPIRTTPAAQQASRVYYRTRDGRADYAFSFERQADGGWRAYIVSQPSYGGRPTGAHPTHRLSDGPRHYVCWDSPLRTQQEARRVAALWADATQTYIRTGRSF